MDHRESPPVESWAGEPPRGPLPGLADHPLARRLVRGRLARAALIAAASIALAALVGSWALQALADWLHRQPAHQLAFRDIALAEPPPDWVKGGREGLLDRIRARANQPETVPVLALDLAEFKKVFALHPLVERVDRLERVAPGGLVVRLRYREPVARVVLPATTLYLDRDGVVLPEEDLDLRDEAPLIRLAGLPEPLDALPGLPLKAGTGPDRSASILAATRLAAFIRAQERTAGRPALHVDLIHLHDGGLWPQLRPSTRVLWGTASHSDGSQPLSPERKWALLREWAKKRGGVVLDAPKEKYLMFEGEQVREALSPR
jgi:hypothetical protein